MMTTNKNLFLRALLAALALAGCSTGVTINNNAGVNVRVIIVAGEDRQVFSPTPGNSSFAETGEGSHWATVVADREWIEYATATRRFLNEQLANSDNLSGQQLLTVIRRLKEIAQQMQQFEAAAGSTAQCAGSVSSEKAGVVAVTLSPVGTLALACN
jgi:hypothetical protein